MISIPRLTQVAACFAMAASLCRTQGNSPSSAPNLSAREIFYVAENVAPPAPPATSSSSAPKGSRSASRTANRTLKATSSASQRTESAQSTGSAPPDGVAPTSSAASSSEARAHFVAVMDRRYPPLGLRYTVERLGDSGKQAVASDTVFHSSDHIQFTVSVSAPGYLYVLSRGASGKWSTLFPPANAASGANLVQARQNYTFPPGQVITFTDPAGEERVFLFLSRQPVRSTEDLMLQLSGKNKTTVEAPSDVPDTLHSPDVEAFNRMDDSRVQLLRTSYARDLIVEEVNAGSAADEHAVVPEAPVDDTSVYVVNPSAGADAHVVADVQFRHE